VSRKPGTPRNKQFTESDDALLAELGVEAAPEATGGRSAREERVLAGFEEIQRFVAREGRLPVTSEGRDIFERLYAVRLERLRHLAEFRELLTSVDHQGLLGGEPTIAFADLESLDDDALLSELGVRDTPERSLTELRFVKSAAEKRAAAEIANRERCEDFEQFKPRFVAVREELARGARETRRFERKAEIEPGRFYVLDGQLAFVASMGEPYINESGNRDARLRVIYDNGTESKLLMRSLQRALQQDPTGRRITEPSLGPLFSGEASADATPSGSIYVLRSRLDHPFVAAHRDIIHKIGVTGGPVDRRVGDTLLDPTFLMGEVEVVATYQLFDLNRTRLEGLIHRVFSAARLDIEVPDRFGNPVRPQEWFLVPLFVIDEAIDRIRQGSITSVVYDPTSARLVLP
jgi:hypothetical protein